MRMRAAVAVPGDAALAAAASSASRKHSLRKAQSAGSEHIIDSIASVADSSAYRKRQQWAVDVS